MITTTMLAALLAEAAQAPAEGGFSIDLAIWKWVVIIGAGAIVIAWLVRRIAEVVVKRKTERIIERVVGPPAKGAGQEGAGWSDLDDLDGPAAPPDPKP